MERFGGGSTSKPPPPPFLWESGNPLSPFSSSRLLLRRSLCVSSAPSFPSNEDPPIFRLGGNNFNPRPPLDPETPHHTAGKTRRNVNSNSDSTLTEIGRSFYIPMHPLHSPDPMSSTHGQLPTAYMAPARYAQQSLRRMTRTHL